MKKKTIIILLSYLIYAVAIYLYLFHIAPTGIPEAYLGTPADPATFMPTLDIATSITFARTRHLIFFLSTPFEWLVIIYFISGGMSDHFEDVVKSRINKRWLQTTTYYLMYAIFTFFAMLPFRFISYQLARFYGTSTMTLAHWIRNRGIDFLVDFLLIMVIIHVVLFLIKKFPRRWWLATWLAFIPFAFFFMFIRPVLIDPLYNDFQPLENEVLERGILNMAEEAGISADSVFVVEVSDRTNTINGYVTGVGPTARIVLWDTAIEQLSEDAVMFLMAHEIAHYVYRDIYRGIVVAIVFAFGGLFVVYKIIDKMDKDSLKRIPVALLTVWILLFAVSPATNWISRRIEVRADIFALEMTNDPEGGIDLFQTLARTSLNEINPPTLVYIFRSTHPSLFERISTLIED